MKNTDSDKAKNNVTEYLEKFPREDGRKSVPDLLKLATNKFLKYRNKVHLLEIVKPIYNEEKKIINANEYAVYASKCDELEKEFNTIIGMLTIEPLGNSYSKKIIKLIETLKKYFLDSGKRELVTEIFSNEKYEVYSIVNSTIVSFERAFIIIDKILKPTKFDNSVARKNDIWRPHHLTLSTDLTKLDLEIDKDLDRDYLHRCEEYEEMKIKTNNPIKSFKKEFSKILNSEAKRLGVEKLEGKLLIEAEIKFLNNRLNELEILLKEF